MENNYYVYKWIRLDNNTIFYIGKGHENRYKKLSDRNKHFKNIYNSVETKVEIIKENLTEQEALDLEVEIIHYLVFEEDYGIDIDGYRKYGNTKHLANATWGGEGISGYKHTEESRQKMSEAKQGENHPMYGRTGENHPNAKAVICITTNAVFTTAKEGGEYYNCNHSNIIQCCKGKGYKSAGKYQGQKLVWRYIEIIEL